MHLNFGRSLNMEGIGGSRTQEEINFAVEQAKLNREDLNPTTQTFYVDKESAVRDKYLLLELDNNLLSTIKQSEKLVFKGSENDDIVLCTENRTYDIRECETTNNFLIVPDLKFSKQLQTDSPQIEKRFVIGINQTYLEALPCKPHLSKILRTLQATKYSGPENEYKTDKSLLMTYDEMFEVTQSSEVELKTQLNKLNVIEFDSKVRLLDMDYQFRVLSFMLKSIDENSWPLDEINKEETVNAWSELVPRSILDAVFDIYVNKSKVVDGVQLYEYDQFRVGQFFARILLEYAGKFNLNEFMQAWKDSMPEGMSVREEMLFGIAVINRSCTPHVIWAFPESQLPENIKERFEALFAAKPKWSVSEIKSYIESLATDKMDANAILAKYARASNVDGVRHYSSKHEN